MVSLADVIDYTKPWLIWIGALVVFVASFLVGDFVFYLVGQSGAYVDDPSNAAGAFDDGLISGRGYERLVRRGRGKLNLLMMLPKAAVGFATVTLTVAPFVLAWILLRRPPTDGTEDV